MLGRPRPLVCLVALALVAAACGIGDNADVQVAPLADVQSPASSSSSTSSSTPASIPSTSTTTTSTTTSTTTTSTTTTVAPGAVYFEQPYTLFATAGPVDLFHPATKIEIIGFHEAGHDGSQQQTTVDGSAPATTLDTRNRNTGSRTAADIVVEPTAAIRSPVTGTVIRGGTYILYCENEDNFLVIEPDAAPGWEVKMFHMHGLTVAVGDRVEAGVTQVAERATVLPFDSQVDEFTAEPSNPHVHIEVIDPSIPDIPSGTGSGC